MNIISKTKEIFASSPIRLPRKVKNIKRWRVKLRELENYIEDLKNFDLSEPETIKL
jgi:hypothetical protein